MGLILDSSVLIAGERRGESVWEILERIRTKEGETKSALSVISVLELTHGIYRAKTDKGRQRRLEFVEELCHAVPVHPVTLEIAKLAGKIEAEQSSQGISIAIPDLLIGVTALHLSYSVASLNARHFSSIPGLAVIQL